MIKRIIRILIVTNLIFFLVGCVVKKENDTVIRDYPIISYQYIPEKLSVGEDLTIEEENFIMLLFSGLVYEDKQGGIKGALAGSFKYNSEENEYIFQLKDNIKWSNGDKILAEDIKKFFLNFLKSENTNYKDELFCIKGAELYSEGRISDERVGIEVEDEDTIIFKLGYANGNFLRILSQPAFVLRNVSKENDWKNSYKDILYSGAYKIENIQDENIYLIKNEEFFDANSIESEKIGIDTREEEYYALAHLETNMIDIMVNINYVAENVYSKCENNITDDKDLTEKDDLKEEKISTKEHLSLFFNLDNDRIMRDFKIRRAIIEILNNDSKEVILQFNDLDEEVDIQEKEGYETEDEKIDMYGIKGKEISILLNIEDEKNENYCEEIKNKLESQGMIINIIYTENSDEFMKEINAGNFDICLNLFLIDDNTRGYLLKLMSSSDFNTFSYTNSDYDFVLNKYFFEEDYIDKVNLINEAKKILEEDLVYDNIMSKEEYVLMNNSLEGIWYNERGNIHFENMFLKN
ncbi:ABC transporter substrate-binding protein [Clostridium sp. DL1XJH146]